MRTEVAWFRSLETVVVVLRVAKAEAVATFNNTVDLKAAKVESGEDPGFQEDYSGKAVFLVATVHRVDSAHQAEETGE